MNKPLRSSKNYSYCKPTSVLFSESAMPNFFETEKKDITTKYGRKKVVIWFANQNINIHSRMYRYVIVDYTVLLFLNRDYLTCDNHNNEKSLPTKTKAHVTIIDSVHL